VNKGDWNICRERLGHFYGQVDLVCDGYRVTLRLERTGTMKLGIMVYVNGRFEPKWLFEESEEGRRFLPVRRYHLWNSKNRTAFKKMSRKTLRLLKIDPDIMGESKGHCWGSFARMKAHFCKHNKSIEIAKAEEATIREEGRA
jgi:hypothetical protein